MSLLDDARELTRSRATFGEGARRLSQTVLRSDAFRVLLLQRAREGLGRLRVPLAGHLLRVAQTALYGIEIGKLATLGRGVNFVHPVGIVVGGTSVVGDRVTFFGCNTLGSIHGVGYPTIEEDVIIGAGARILGAVRVGARAEIGANAVVLKDVPPDSVAVGIPAVVRPRRTAGAAQRSGLPGPGAWLPR